MNKNLLYLLLSLLFLGCSKSQVEPPQVEVSIFGSSSSASSLETSRTAIGSDLKSSVWSDGDQIAVWAKASGASSYTLAASKFSLRYFTSTFTTAEFSATIPEMAEGSYTYYGVYPYPNAVNGTKATFTLADTQSGEYDGVNDIMVATPAESRELSETTYLTPASMNFNHLMHIFRIYLPAERNEFGGPLHGLEVSFSQNVVGSVMVDAANENIAPVLSNGKKTVTLNFDEPFESGEGKYLWMFMNPTTLSGEVTFVGLGEDGIRSDVVTTSINKTLAAGAITPISIPMKAPKKLTTISVSIPKATMLAKIGEPLESVTFTLPSGVTFDDGTSKVTMKASENGGSDVYELYLYNASNFGASLTGGKLGVQLDTKSVVKTISGGMSLSNIKVDGESTLTVPIPNFFYTNFSEINENDNGPEKTDDDEVNTGVGGLPNWVGGCRSYWYKDKNYISLYSYAFKIFAIIGPYQSRMTTCTMADWGLKSGKTVNLKITYYAKWTKNVSPSMSIRVGRTTKTVIGDNFDSEYTKSLSNKVNTLVTASGTVNGSNAIDGVTSGSRIAWQTIGNNNNTGYDEVQISDVTITIEQ